MTTPAISAICVLVVAACGFAVWWWARRGNRPSIEHIVAFRRDALTTLCTLGWATEDDAILWFRVEQPLRASVVVDCEEWPSSEHAELELAARDSTDNTSVAHLKQLLGRPLDSARKYKVTVTTDGGSQLLTSEFRTAPLSESDAPAEFALGFLSCHQPFDDCGNLLTDAEAMLEAATSAFDARGVDRLLLLGDQVYSDHPDRLSLFNPDFVRAAGLAENGDILSLDEAPLRHAFFDRYRSFWKVPGFVRMLQRFPHLMVPDDHDFRDNWGSTKEHANAAHQKMYAAALDAWQAYQGSRRQPLEHGRDGVDTSFTYGPAAVFAMDLRTSKRVMDDNIQIYSDAQFGRLDEFLNKHGDLPFMLLALSVPFLHLPEWIVGIGTELTADDGDVADRWSNPAALSQRNRLLLRLREHQRNFPEQQLIVLGGDIHLGLMTKFTWQDGSGSFIQVVSSAVSNRQSELAMAAAEQSPGVVHELSVGEHTLLGETATVDGTNPWGGLNVGVLRFKRSDDTSWQVAAEVIGLDDSYEWCTAASHTISGDNA